MTSSPKIPKISKGNKMSDTLRSLVGKRITKSVKFMGTNVEIQKMSVAEVMEIQNIVKNMKDNEDDMDNLNTLKFVIRQALPEAADLTDDEFDQFPLEELSKLSQEIMKWSGIDAQAGK